MKTVVIKRGSSKKGSVKVNLQDSNFMEKTEKQQDVGKDQEDIPENNPSSVVTNVITVGDQEQSSNTEDVMCVEKEKDVSS